MLVGRGVATLDLGIGRTFRALGPRSWQRKKSSPRNDGATGPDRICEKRITVTSSPEPTSRLYSWLRKWAISSVRRISGLSCSISRGESSPSVLTSTLSITSSKIRSRGL